MNSLNVWSKDSAKWLDEFCFKDRFTDAEEFIISEIKKLPRDIKILDYGCGTGRFIEILKKEIPDYDINNYLGIDTSENMINLAKEKHENINFDLANLDDLACDNFDIVVCLDVLQHQNDPISFLDKLLSINSTKIFIEFWTKKDAQNLDNSKKVITLDSTKEKFFENIYSHETLEELASLFNLKYMIFYNQINDIALLYI